MSGSLPRPMEGTTYNLLFVCSGNTCRSPMAEAITRGMLEERGWTHVDVRSAGTGAVPGVAASEEAVDVARAHDLDLAHHTSRPLTLEHMEWADLVLVMGPSHLHVVRELGGAGKAALITDFIEGEGQGQPVADPFGGGSEEYRDAFHQIELAVTALLERLEPILSP